MEVQRCPGHKEATGTSKPQRQYLPTSPDLHPLGLEITMHHLILSLGVTSGRMGEGVRGLVSSWSGGHQILNWAAEDGETPCLPPLPAVYVSLIFSPMTWLGEDGFPKAHAATPASSLMRRALPGPKTPHNCVFMVDSCTRNTQAAYVVMSALMLQV